MRNLAILFLLLGTFLQASAQRQLGMNKPGNPAGSFIKPFEHTEGTYVVLNGINMYYEQYGEGKPLLLIHGNGGSAEDFDAQLSTLSRKFKVIVPNSRGQGFSSNQADSLTYELLAEDYYLLLQHLELDSVYVLGWSDGGIIGLILAKDYPGTVSKLAISGANLQPDSTALLPEFLTFAQAELKKVEDSLAAGNTTYKSAKDLLHLALYHPDIDPDDLSDIQIPVLVISGDHDIVRLEHTIEIYTHLPNAELSIFPGTTHAVLKDAPQLFNNTVQRFFLREFKQVHPLDILSVEEDNTSGEE